MDTAARTALAAFKVTEVAVADLVADPQQPRKSFDQAELAPLVASIKERGILQPIQVRVYGGLYMIVDGERRWRAAKAAKLKNVPVILYDVHEDDVKQLRVDQVAVNELRKGLKPLELARVLQKLRDEERLSPNEIAAYLDKNGLGGLTRNQVEDLIGLTELPPWAHELVEAGKVEPKVIGAVRRFKDQPEVMKGIKSGLSRAEEWRDPEPPVAGLDDLHTGDVTMQEAGDGTHAEVVQRLLHPAGIVERRPALPDRRRSLVAHEQPRRRRALEQHFVGEIEVTGVSEHWEEEGRAEEARAEMRVGLSNVGGEVVGSRLSQLGGHEIERERADEVGLRPRHHPASVVDELSLPRVANVRSELRVALGALTLPEHGGDLGQLLR